MILTLSQRKSIDAQLRLRLGQERYLHVLSVRDLAVDLARQYGVETEAAEAAALLHDYVKWQNFEELIGTAEVLDFEIAPLDRQYPKILHALVGAEVARHEFGITNEAILAAIRQHTTGDAGMGILAKILYVADHGEPRRTHALALSVREQALRGRLDAACLLAAVSTLNRLLAKRALIHPRSIAAYNDLLGISALCATRS